MAVTAVACGFAYRGLGTPDAAIHGAFALFGLAGLRLRSWTVIGALAGAYIGGAWGPMLGDSPINPPAHALLPAVCGASIGLLAEMRPRREGPDVAVPVAPAGAGSDRLA